LEKLTTIIIEIFYDFLHLNRELRIWFQAQLRGKALKIVERAEEFGPNGDLSKPFRNYRHFIKIMERNIASLSAKITGRDLGTL